MRSNYYDFLSGRVSYEEALTATSLTKKQAEEEKKKRAKQVEINEIVNKATIDLRTATYDLNDKISTLTNRVNELERTAADRSRIPKRPRRKLTIKVSA